MIYIIGIKHIFQRKPNLGILAGGPIDDRRDLIDLFDVYLSKVIDELTPDGICEEYSQSKVDSAPGGSVSVAANTARVHGIEHIFCDPDEAERSALFGRYDTTCELDASRGWPVREGEWIVRMKRRWQDELPNKKLLFLCGADHVETLSAKLQAIGLLVSTYCADLEYELQQQR